MAEKIKILELDIDAGAMIKKSADSRKELERLKDEVKFLQKSLKEGDGIIDSTRTRLAELQKQGKGNSKEYEDLSNSLEGFIKKQDENSQKLEIVSSGLRKQQADYRMSKKQVDVYNTTVESQLGIITKTDGSINQLNQALGNNRKIYRGLTEEQRNNEQIGGRLLTLINEQDKEYKELQKSIGTTQVEVGNYKEQIKEALTESSSFSTQIDAQIAQIPIIGSSLSVTTKYLRGYAQGQIASAAATDGTSKSLKLFKVALISTGIGAILVALGLLVAALSKSQRFTDFFTKALAPLKGGFEAVLGIIQDLAFSIDEIATEYFGQFKDNFTILKNTFLQGVDSMRLAWNKLTGDQEEIVEIQSRMTERQKETTEAVQRTAERWEKVKGFVSDSVDRIKEGAETQQKVVQLGIQIEESENRLIILRSELNRKIKEQNKIAEDITKTQAEREAAAKRSIELSKQLVTEEQAVLDLKIKQKTLENSINETSRADQKELNELIAQRNEKETQGLELQTTQTNKLNTIRQSAEAQRQKAVDAAINKAKEEIDLYIAQEGIKAKTLSDSLKLEENIRDKKLAILKKELDAKKISRTKYETEVLNTKQEFLQKQSELTLDNAQKQIEYAQKELDIYIAQNQSKIDNEAQLTQALISEEEKRQQEIYNRKLSILEEQRANELISEQDFYLEKLILQADYLEQEAALKEQYDTQEREKKEAQKVADREIEILEAQTQFEEQRIREQQQNEQRLIDLTARLEQSKITQEQYNKLEEAENKRHSEVNKAINQAVLDAKLSAFQSVFGQIKGLFGEETAVGKAAAIAETTINAYKAATAAYSALAGIPVVGPALGAVAAGLAVASGLANVKKITSTNIPKAEKGIALDIGGKRHSDGGTKFYGEDGTAFEAEKGESLFVLSRRASAAFAPLLSDINQQYGGVSLSNSTSYLASGGQILRGAGVQPRLSIDYDVMANKIAQANLNLPQPNIRVAVEDINAGQNNYAQVVNGANL